MMILVMAHSSNLFATQNLTKKIVTGNLLCEIDVEGFIIFSCVYSLIVHAYICGMSFFLQSHLWSLWYVSFATLNSFYL
jgi:hypothetical protein